jgi:hypothetical protein
MSDLAKPDCTCSLSNPFKAHGGDPAKCPAHGDPELPAPEWCPECGCARFVDSFEWEVDVSRDGPDGPEWELAILDCGHDVATGRRRGQHYP